MTTTATLTKAEGLVLANEYAAAVQRACDAHMAAKYPTLRPYVITVEAGNKFARIVQDSGQRSVHAFVDLTTGNVIKAAGWKAPQRGVNGLAVRFRLTDPVDRQRCFDSIDPYGSYLYER